MSILFESKNKRDTVLSIDEMNVETVWLALSLVTGAIFPAAVLGQEELPNELKKTQTSAQDLLPRHESHQAAIVLLLTIACE